MVSTQLVDNGSERERYAQTQKQIQKKKKKDDKWRNAKSTMPNKFCFFFLEFNHSLQLLNLNVSSLNEYHLLYVFHIQILLNKMFYIINIDMLIVRF